MKEKENLPLKKQEFDPVLLGEKRDKLFDTIIHSPERHGDALPYAKRIFEHSIEDGIKFAEKVYLAPGEIAECLRGSSFAVKHEKFMRALQKEMELKKNSLTVSQRHFEKVTPAFIYLDALETDYKNGNLLKMNVESSGSNGADLTNTALLDEIDTYYSQFLQKDIPKPKKLTKEEEQKRKHESKQGLTVEEMKESIEQFLHKTEAVIEGRYYAAEIEKIIFDTIKKQPDFDEAVMMHWSDHHQSFDDDMSAEKLADKLRKADANDFDLREVVYDYLNTHSPLTKEELEQFRYSPSITKELAEKVLHNASELSEPEIEKKLADVRYKPLNIVYNQEKAFQEHFLKKMFKEEGIELVLNPETDQYEIEEKKEESEKKEDTFENKQAKAIVTHHAGGYEVKIDKGDGSPTMDWGLFDSVSNSWNTHMQYLQGKIGDKIYVINEKGKFGPYNAVQSIQRVQGVLTFIASHGGEKGLVADDGGEISRDPFDRDLDDITDFYEHNGVLVIQGYKDGKPAETQFTPEIPSSKKVEEEKEIELTEKLKFGTPTEKYISREALDDRAYEVTQVVGGEVSFIVTAFPNYLYEKNGEIKITPKQRGVASFEDMTEINGERALLSKRNDGRYEILFGYIPNALKTILLPKEYQDISFVKGIDYQLIYRATKQDGKRVFVNMTAGNKEFGGSYGHMDDPILANNEIVYPWTNALNHCYIVSGIHKPQEKPLKQSYDFIQSIVGIKGKMAFTARMGTKTFVAVDDGREIGMQYDIADNPINFNGTIAFFAMDGGEKFIATEDGKEFLKDHSYTHIDVKKHVVIDQTLIVTAYQNKKAFLVTHEGRKISTDFQEIKDVVLFGDSIIVIGIKEGKLVKEEISFSKYDKETEYREGIARTLEVLNLIHKPELEKIKAYFGKYPPEDKRKWHEKLRDEIVRSKEFLYNLPLAIKNAPKAFLDTLPAKRDRAIEHQVKKILYKIAPELYENEKGASGLWGAIRPSSGARSYEPRAEAYLEQNTTHQLFGGDPLEAEKGKAKDVLILRENINELIANGIYGTYENDIWKKALFSLPFTPDAGALQTTITIPNVQNARTVRLPKPLNSRIISERVKGILPNGTEINLDAEINSLGEAVVLDKKGAKEIVYSIEKNKIPDRMSNIDQAEYEQFARAFERENEVNLTEEIADLPEEMELFIQSLEDKTPKEKVTAIETFVRGIGYYDFDNAEVMDEKQGKTIEERMMIMEDRMDELKRRKPEQAQNLLHKRYAGVCADYAAIVSALLRRAGIVSGIVSGFAPNGKTVTTAHSHAVAFALFPDELNQTKIFTVDGTPGGVTEEENKKLAELGILTKNREELEETTEAEISVERQEAERKLDEILKVIGGNNEEAIKQLSNGQLETVLNTILKYSVKASHLEALRVVLNGYWYTPYSAMPLDDVKNQVEIGKFLSSELKSVRKKITKESSAMEIPAGTYLFDTVREFAERFIREEKEMGETDGYVRLEKIFDLARGDLNEIERKSVAAIITYLRAKKMRAQALDKK